MRKVNKDPFSNGTEYDVWNERNCENCIKASRYKGEDIEGEIYTKGRCAIQRDIATRMIGDEPISQRTIDICSHPNCPYKIEHYPKREKFKNEPKLFEL